MDINIRGGVSPHKPVRDRVPIYAAAMQEGMCRMAGDVADGLIGHPMCAVRWLDEVVIPSFETGLQRSGRQRSDLDFIPTITTIIDDDEARPPHPGPPTTTTTADEGAPPPAAGRRTIAFYSTVRTYKPLWEMHGFADAAEAAGNAFRQGDLAAVPEQIPDEMVDAYTAAGPLDKVRARVAAAAERGDGVWLTPPTYFIPPEQIGEYQAKIMEAFGPA